METVDKVTHIAVKGGVPLQERFRDPLLTALTTMLAVLLFVVSPLQVSGIMAAHYFGLVFAVVLIAAVFIVSRSWLAVAAILVALALVLAATALRLRHPSVINIYLDPIAWMVTGVTLSLVVARAVFARGRVTYHRFIGAVLLYMTIGVVFVAAFRLAELLIPNASRGIGELRDNLAVAGNLIYFSFVTMTSVGYGDIIPVHPYARSLANSEAIIGQLCPATLLARLVTLELAGRRT